METFPKWNKSTLREMLTNTEIKPQKSLGQHFLIDTNFLKLIVKEADILPSEDVIEIGAGVGSLTAQLLEKAKTVWAFEIDKKIYNICKTFLGNHPKLKLFNENGIKACQICPKEKTEYKVISNLPYVNYYDLLINLLTGGLPIKECYLLVQLEVYKKMAGEPLSKKYTALSVILQSICNVKFLRIAPRELFYPMPNVDSAFIKLSLLENPLVSTMELNNLIPYIKMLFMYRRKLLKNALQYFLQQDLYTKLENIIGESFTNKRVESLSVEDVVKIAKSLAEVFNQNANNLTIDNV